MLQIGNLSETLYSVNSPADEITIVAPSGWQAKLTPEFVKCFDSFTWVDLLKNDLCRSIQKFQSDHLANILVIASRDNNLNEIIPGPCFQGVPVGILLADHSDELLPWLQAIRDTHLKTTTDSYHVLAMWKPFYLMWANRFVSAMMEGFSQNGSRVIPLFADNTSRDTLCEALWQGPQLALYVGHGRSRGWSGYRGFRWKHIAENKQIRPIGSLITLTCDNLKPGREGKVPFGVRWVLTGRAGAFLGAIDSIEVKPLETIAQFFLDHFASGEITNVGQLISSVNQNVNDCGDHTVHENWSCFRLIGNPLQRL